MQTYKGNPVRTYYVKAAGCYPRNIVAETAAEAIADYLKAVDQNRALPLSAALRTTAKATPCD